MNFRKWLINESAKGAYGWDGVKWYKVNIGDNPEIQVYITKNRIMVEPSPYHPHMKRAIRQLLRRWPNFTNIKIEFDGWSPGTMANYLKDPSLHQRKDQLPRYLYTGTSLHRWERIKEEGLRPRADTSTDAAFGAEISSAPPANPNHVYLAATYGSTVRWAANDASRDGSSPVVLKVDIRGLHYNNLRPDVDMRTGDWVKSFHGMNTIAYEGVIPPQNITLYKAYNFESKQWEDPGEWLEPQDWLAQQTLHKKDYKQIPDSTASYKWVKPN